MSTKNVIFLFLLFAACKSEETEIEKIDSTEFIENAKPVEQYKGIIPCADCMGIEVVLTLNNDQSFSELNTYLTDKIENPQFLDKGTYKWKNDTLVLNRKEGVSMKLKTDTALMSFDGDGKLMKDEFGIKYNLTKVF